MAPKNVKGSIKSPKRITVDTKKEIIAKHESGIRVSDLAKQYDMAKSTICTILKNKDALKKADVSKGVTKLTKQRPQVLHEVEKWLLVWINERELKGDCVSEASVCAKALELYRHLLVIQPSASDTDIVEFKASRGWYEKFRRRTGIGVGHGEVTTKVKKTTSLDHFLNLEVKVNTGVPESDHDMAKVPAITIKEEPMSDPEDNAPSLGAPTSTTPSLTSVTSLAKFSASSGPGEILGLPFGDLPTGPGSPPPSKSPSVASEVSNARLEKNRFLPSRSPTNESGEQAKLVSDYKRRDQFDVYGEYIASKLRRLDRRTCAHVQRAFGDIIFEAEMGKYR